MLIILLACQRIERGDAVYLIIPELDTVRHAVEGLDRRENIHRIAIHTETAAFELQLIIHVQSVYKPAQQLIPVDTHTPFQMRHFLGESLRVCHAI